MGWKTQTVPVREELGIYGWFTGLPRQHLILSLLSTSLSQSDILEGLSILSGLSGRVGQLVSCTRVSS